MNVPVGTSGRMREVRGDAGEAQAGAKPIGRRVVLGMLGLGALGVVAGRRIQDGLSSALAPVQRLDPTGLSGLLPGNYFRIYTVTDGYPHADAATYRLTVDGLVQRPLSLSLAQVEAMPSTSLVRDFQCVTGWRVPAVHWTGVLLSTLLDMASPRPGAKALRFESFDGTYTESLTLTEAYRPDVIVAYDMLGAPLTTPHGGPLRLYVAPMYGYKSIKWLSHIQVVDRVEPGFWETAGNYDVEAWVGRSNGRTDPSI